MRIFVVVCLLFVSTGLLADQPKLKSVNARTLKLNIPADWKEVATTSKMRAAQFSIPGEGDEKTDLVVFYFGGPTGGIKANVDRWVGQFEAKDREVKMTQGDCDAGSCIMIDVTGTWNKPDGPPFARKTISTPGSRVVNVIVTEEEGGKPKDYYFLKLSGSKKSVSKQVAALRKSLGGDAKADKPFDLKDARN